MKTPLMSVLAICLGVCVPAAAWAADDHADQNKGGGRGAQSVQHSAPQRSAPSAGPARGTQGGERNAFSVQHTTPSVRSTSTTEVRTHQHRVMQTQSGGRFGTNSAQSTGTQRTRHATTGIATGSATTTRAATRSHANVNVASYNRNITAQHRYRSGSYNAPQGYSYHRYGYGDELPQEYYANNFWIVDFSEFGLLSPPDGYVWVRYGPDAILIDEDTGEIVQVVYNQFYS
jgi:Ni/Co efflux regulator RcnB